MIRTVSKPYGNKIVSKSRWIKLHYGEQHDDYYFTHYGKRYYINDFSRLTYPMFYRDNNGKDCYISGYENGNWYNPYLIEIHPDGEYIRLWEEIKGDK